MLARAAISIASLAPAALGQQLDELVVALRDGGVIHGEMIGIDGHKSAVYRTYERLRALASPAELEALLRHESPVVAGYAARALLDIEADLDWQGILRRHGEDLREVTAQEGCSVLKTAYGDHLFELVRARGVLSAADRLELGEWLVRSESPLYAREHALRELRFSDGMLGEIRALAKAGEAPAAIALARYGIARDVPILVEHLRKPRPFDDNCRFLAAEISGDPRLLPELIALEPAAARRLQRDVALRLRFWLRAVAAHRNREAADCLLRVLRLPPRSDYAVRSRRATLAEVVAPHADVAAFAALRAELAR